MSRTLSTRILMSLTLLFGAVSAAAGANRFYMEAANIEPDETKTLAFILDNEQPFYGFQADITIPEGLEVVTNSNGQADITLSPRADASYTLIQNMLEDGLLRIGTFSTTHSPLTGDTGILFSIRVKADSNFNGGTLRVDNILFIGENDRDVDFPDYSIQIGSIPNNCFYIPDFEITVNETKSISIILDNETPFTAFQTDLYLPEGLAMQPQSLKLSSRASSEHSVSTKSFSDGRIRIACLSLANTPFNGDSGALMEFEITATKEVAEECTIELRNQIFTKSNGKEYVLPNSITCVTTERTLVTEIKVTPSSIGLKVGDTTTLLADVFPSYSSADEVEWTSENPNIAIVSATGELTAIGIGTTIIKATAVDGSGVYGTCNVEVSGIPIQRITLSSNELKLEQNSEYQLAAIIEPSDATDKSIEWSSLNPNIASVDQDGTIHAYEPGETIITASTLDGSNLSDECIVTVDVETGLNNINQNNFEITVEPSQIRLSNVPVGHMIRLFDLNGMLLKAIKSEREDLKLDVMPCTWYIINIGTNSMKIYSN